MKDYIEQKDYRRADRHNAEQKHEEQKAYARKGKPKAAYVRKDERREAKMAYAQWR